MPQHKLTINIEAKNAIESLKALEALQTIAQNITPENLALLADKSKKAGVNVKIQMFKSYI